jgi:hypothetical protein
MSSNNPQSPVSAPTDGGGSGGANKTDEPSPGGNPMGTGQIIGVCAYIAISIIVVMYFLIVLWPPNRVQQDREAQNEAIVSRVKAVLPSPTPTPTQTTTATQGAGATTPNRTGTQTSSPTSSPTPSPTATPTPAALVTGDQVCFKYELKANYCLCNGEKQVGVSPLIMLTFMPKDWQVWKCIYDEDRLLLIVLLAGALGALVHALRSISWYVGNRFAYKSWSAMYFLLPLVGAGIAFIFYLLIRGGFTSPGAQVSDTSPFGFAAMAALIGLFTEQAILKLKAVGETILAPSVQGKDTVAPKPTVSTIDPKEGPTTGGTPITITGANFTDGATITIGDTPAVGVVFVSPTLLKATTDKHDAGTVDVVVTNKGEQRGTLVKGFTYLATISSPPI